MEEALEAREISLPLLVKIFAMSTDAFLKLTRDVAPFPQPIYDIPTAGSLEHFLVQRSLVPPPNDCGFRRGDPSARGNNVRQKRVNFSRSFSTV
jgi:hypothetical protein